MDNRRVLALMPHPDDIEILCAGTLMRLRERGFDLHVATMTPGDKGAVDRTRDQIAAIRRDEAKRAAELLGASSYACLEFADLEIVFDNDARRRVAALLRVVNPQIVFTTPPADYMFDHEITSHLVRDACFNAAVKNYETAGNDPPTTQIPTLYYSDPIGGQDLFGRPAPADCVVDISAQIEQKAAALACHESQRAWLRRQHGLDDYIDSMKRWNQARGQLIGVAYGEAFRQHRGHPHPAESPLQDLLGAIPINSAL